MAILEAAFANKQGQTPQDVERRRRMAAALVESGAGGRPPASGLELAGRLAMTLTGQYQGAKAEREDATNRANANKSLVDALLGSSSGSGFTPSVSSPAPSSASVSAPTSTVDISGSREEFVNSILPAAIEEGKRTGVDPRIIVAQAAQETGWGKSAPGNNYFGIKSHGQDGGNSLMTTEVINGQPVRVRDSFRAYGSPAESVRGYGDFILQNPRYKGLREAQGLDAQLAALGASGYATDPNYAASVGSIARGIKLPTEVASLDPSSGMTAYAPQTATQAIQQQAPQLPAPTTVATPPSPPQTAAITGQQPQGNRVSSALLAQAAPQEDNRAKIAQLLANPYTEEAGQQLLMQEVKRRQEASDPLRQLEIEKTQAEIEKLRNPDADFITGRDGSIFKVDKRGGTVEQVYGGKPDLPTNVQEYEYAKSQGYPGTFQEFQLEGKKAGASQVNIDQKAEGAFDKTLAEKQAATFSAMADEGMNARGDLAVIGELDSLLKGQGGALTGLSAVAAKYGVPVEGADDLQAANALINKLVPSQRTPGSGTMSDGDVALFRASLPSLWNQPGGNQKILNTMRGMAAYKQAQGEIADQVIAGEMTRQEARRALRELPNPLEEYRSMEKKSAPSAPPPAENPLPPTPTSLENMPAPEGMDPNVWKFMPIEDRKLWQK